MARICVFCGSSLGAKEIYVQVAQQLGVLMVQQGLGLVYGGASVGIMGEIANTVLKEGGEVVGVIPQFMVDKEVAHQRLTDLRIVNSMHERKALMANLADGFIALPGGLGTLEEFCEILTWAQLDIHNKPCGLLNIGQYYDGLIAFIDHSVTEGFIKPADRKRILIDEVPENLLEKMANYQADPTDKWLGINKA